MTIPAEKKANESRHGLTEVTPLSPERAQSSHKARAQEVRKQRGRRLAKRLLLFVGLPTLVSVSYYGLLASPQFESYSTFAVQSSEMRPSLGVDGLLAGLATNSGAGHDALEVRNYVISRDMLARLDKEHHFIAHYKDASHDFLSRMSASARFEDAYEYFEHKVAADYEASSGTITIRVRAFSPDQALKMARAILTYSEEMVNKLSERERQDRTAYADAEVKRAEARLGAARTRIVALQREHGEFSPLQAATAAVTLRTQLEAELAKGRAELMQLKSYMTDDAPQVRTVEEKVKSLSAQVAGESQRLVASGKSGGLSASYADFEAAMVEKEFAQKSYESAMATLELARADAARQHRYVAVIAAPSKPDAASYPHRIRSSIAAFVVSFLIWGIGSMMLATVREHARL
jgi:capsular polysaccharide transport system permease protein